MSIWSSLKTYKSNWKESSSRAFSEEEIKAVKEVRVVESNYGRSVCFFIPQVGKKYIPVEETCPLEVGDTPNMEDLSIVSLTYVGASPEKMKATETIRIRYTPKEDKTSKSTFENPFGL